jgi:hypothetical protein
MHADTIALIEMLDEMERVLGKADSNMLRALLSVAKEARLVACEIALFALNFEIDSPQITPVRKAVAIHRRDTALIQWGEIMTDLAEFRRPSGSPALQELC